MRTRRLRTCHGTRSHISVVLLCTTLGLASGACGSSQRAPDEPTAAGSPAGDNAGPLDATDSPEPSDAALPQGPDCADGTCFICGEGMCPLGAYCDVSAPSGPACAWLSECPQEPSCACIERVLGAACSCQASQGPLVTCR